MYFPANSAFPDHLQSVIFSSTTKLLEKLLLPPKLPRKVAKNNAGSQPREMDVAWEMISQWLIDVWHFTLHPWKVIWNHQKSWHLQWNDQLLLGFGVQCSFWGGCSLGSIPVTSARAGALALICVLGKHMQWMYGMTENVSNLFIQMPIYLAICPNPGPAQ